MTPEVLEKANEVTKHIKHVEVECDTLRESMVFVAESEHSEFDTVIRCEKGGGFAVLPKHELLTAMRERMNVNARRLHGLKTELAAL